MPTKVNESADRVLQRALVLGVAVVLVLIGLVAGGDVGEVLVGAGAIAGVVSFIQLVFALDVRRRA